ncbi:hypothetical protein NL676_011074 [Syzygium grande]|nr:hypothetical protein NL676_011074 [Syzygium grande]
MGARKLVLVGIGLVGCIPFVRALNLFLPGGSCVIQVNQFIQGYNMKLKELLDELNQAIFVYVNSYDILMEIVLNYRRHGFENADALCRGGFFPPFDCYNATSVMCDDRSKYMFWDAYRPTEAANAVVAQELLDGDQTRSYPHQHSSAVHLSFPQLV